MSTFGKFCQKLPISYFTCTCVWMSHTFLKIHNLLKAGVWLFLLFLLSPRVALFLFSLSTYKKEIATFLRWHSPHSKGRQPHKTAHLKQLWCPVPQRRAHRGEQPITVTHGACKAEVAKSRNTIAKTHQDIRWGYMAISVLFQKNHKKAKKQKYKYKNKHFLVILINFYFSKLYGASRRIFCANYDFGSS